VTDDEDHVGDEYFLTSGDKIRYFLEPDAVGRFYLVYHFCSTQPFVVGKDGLNRDKEKAVNKIGHGTYPRPSGGIR
jgi:phytanoyl-CoA hydroxylase